MATTKHAIMTVGDLKKALEKCKDTQRVVFEIHEEGKTCDTSYGLDVVEPRNTFAILISKN